MLGGSRGGYSGYLDPVSGLAVLASGVSAGVGDDDDDDDDEGEEEGGKRIALARAVVDAKVVMKRTRRRGLEKKGRSLSFFVLGFEDIIILSLSLSMIPD